MNRSYIQPLLLFTSLSLIASGTAFARSYSCSGEGIPHATISFNSGSSYLAEVQRTVLKNLIQDVRKQDKIAQIVVASWSDLALPQKGQELSTADRTLAQRRAEAISSYLTDNMAIADVDAFNMAESANWIAKVFHTSDAELKATFSKKGTRNPVSDKEFRIIREEGAPSEAIVVVKCETED